MACSAPRLVVHFDVNKTVLFTDEASGQRLEDVLNGILASHAWGRVKPETQEWQLATQRLFLTLPPDAPHELLPECDATTHFVNYCDFVDALYPYVEGTAGMAAEERTKLLEHNKAARQKRRLLKDCFTDPGSPGAVLTPVIAELRQKLMVPAPAASHPLFPHGIRRLSAAYFAALQWLAASGRDFAVVFRTFGSDLPDVIAEHNLLCEGKHPLHPGCRYDGLEGSLDLRIHTPHATGRFVRYDDTIALATVSDKDVVDLIHGFSSIADAIHAKIRSGHRVLALRDCYEWWASHGEMAFAGKALAVDPEDLSLHEIFFDDNIYEDDDNIVDVRHRHSGISLTTDTRDVFLVRVSPLEAVLDDEYFIKHIVAVEANRTRLGAGSEETLQCVCK